MTRVLIFLIAVFGVSSCATKPTSYTSEAFDKAEYKRVGLLVTRMGHDNFYELPLITIDTDYSNRRPSADCDYWRGCDYRHVYIEDDTRIQDSFPKYPLMFYQQSSGIENPLQMPALGIERYFDENISSDLYDTLHDVLTEKGYSVINVRKLAEQQENLLSEMTVGEILSSLKDTAHALVVCHYFDRGSYIVADKHKGDPIGLEGIQSLLQMGPMADAGMAAGFSGLFLSLAIFDVSSKERVFTHKISFNIPPMLLNDPDIKNDPVANVRITGNIEYGRQHKYIIHNFSKREVRDYVMKYLRKGHPGGYPIEPKTGIETVLP